MNILVGANAAGKTTIIEAISMVLSGRLAGRNLQEQASPYWFNNGAVADFFAAVDSGTRPKPPEILIQATFHDSKETALFRGSHGPSSAEEAGCTIRVELDSDFEDEFWSSIERNAGHRFLPPEYFRVIWESFAGTALRTRLPPARILNVDGSADRSSYRLEAYARDTLHGILSPREISLLSADYRGALQNLTGEQLKVVNNALKVSNELSDLGDIQIQLDLASSTNWLRGITPGLEGIPLAFVGQGEQTSVKLALALQGAAEAQVVTVEEPENHLSHTSLHRILASVERLCEGRQSFVSTHSSYVMNRLGLDALHLISGGTSRRFNALTTDTVDYFKKLSGFDTLRAVLAQRLVLVEGPTDEMIFKLAWHAWRGTECESDGVDVMEVGISYARILELCTLLNRGVAVIRDADRQNQEVWRERAKKYLAEGQRQIFVGDPKLGVTLEPQMLACNQSDLEAFSAIIGFPDGQEYNQILTWMTENKTDWAFNLVTSGRVVNHPEYIRETVEFVGKDL